MQWNLCLIHCHTILLSCCIYSSPCNYHWILSAKGIVSDSKSSIRRRVESGQHNEGVRRGIDCQGKNSSRQYKCEDPPSILTFNNLAFIVMIRVILLKHAAQTEARRRMLRDRCFVCCHLSRECQASARYTRCHGRHHTSICLKQKSIGWQTATSVSAKSATVDAN